MPCQEIQSWTFKGLVAAFVDLAVAHLLLCASALVYLSSKFLRLFGLSLPCPCDGLFSDPSKNKCFQEVLGNRPVKKISAVQWSVKRKTPFNSILCEEQNRGFTTKERKKECMNNELDGEACGTLAPGKDLGDVAEQEDGSWNVNVSGLDLLSAQSLKKGTYRIKGKGYTVNRSPCGLSYRRKVSFGHKKFPQSSGSVAEAVNDVEEKELSAANSEECGKASENNFLCKSVSLASGVRNKQPERTTSLAADLTSDGNVQKTIKVLEQALEEERAAYAALALELEKERNAAATAADEAMAMILRLQEEKASLEMEARQNQRMIEEKSAFDAEEMSILKEILLRREKEKHFLEKEVENYRQMLLDIEEGKSSFPEAKADLSEGSMLSYSTECVEQTPRPVAISFDDKANIETADIFAGPGVISNQSDNSFLGFGNETMAPRYDCHADSSKLKEVHRVLFDFSGDETPDLKQSTSDELHFHEKNKVLIDGEQQESEEGTALSPPMLRESESSDPKTIVRCGGNKMEKVGEESYDVDCHVHDIHVITDEDRMSDKVRADVLSDGGIASEAGSSVVTWDLKLDRSRSVSDTSYKLPPICPPRQHNMSPDMRRKSMSAVDYERLKIENEVGRLWGRLRAVQQGREKLSHSKGRQREHGNTQLELLEDITARLQGINQIKEAGKSVPYSMVKMMSKKRPCRSASLDQHSA